MLTPYMEIRIGVGDQRSSQLIYFLLCICFKILCDLFIVVVFVFIYFINSFFFFSRLCLSISDFHPDTWNPAWSVSTILTGLLSFMVCNKCSMMNTLYNVCASPQTRDNHSI